LKFLKKNSSKLSNESRKKLETNPLRILDSKNLDDREIIEKSPILINYLDKESKLFFDEIQKNLKNLKIEFFVNPFLVRGLDYYNHTAFEFVTSEDKSQNTILAGGRYDGLVSSLGGNNLSGVGWASGIERIILNLEKINIEKKVITIIASSNDLNSYILKVLNLLDPIDGTSFHTIYSGNLKKKLIKANKMGCTGCIIIGEEEMKENKIIWKNMVSGSQEKFDIEKMNDFLRNKIAN
jgi:histidyl-tRNA synthetase